MDDSSTAGRERRCAAAINAVLGTKPGEPLGDSAVADLAALCRLSEATLRTAVLDRRLAGDSWPEISTQLGTSPQAARKRFTAPSHPDEPAELVEFPDAAAYYAARPALAEAWGFTGDHRPEPGTAPFGSDEGSLRTAAGNWMLTLVAPPGALRFDLWRRVGAPQAAHPCDVVATDREGVVVLLASDVPMAAAARALCAVPREASLQATADAIYGEASRPDVFQVQQHNDTLETQMKTTPYGPALATFPDKAAFYDANPHAAKEWDWKTHPGSAPLGSDVFNDRTGYLVTVCHPNLGLGKDGGAGPVVAFEHKTGEIHVLANSMTFNEARSKFRPLS